MTTTTITTRQYRASSIPATAISATLDQFNAPVASLDLNSQNIINLLDPINPQDASTKAYVDAILISGTITYQGVIDCSANPNYPAADVGYLYIVSIAGKIGGASGVNVEVGDWILCNTTNAGGDQASVGDDFNIVQTNIDGAVTGPASAVSGDFATFNGTTGKIIQDSGLSLTTSTSLGTSNVLIPSQNAVKVYADTKATKVGGGTTNDLVSLTSGGDIQDAGVAVSTDGTFTANSDALIPTQKATKTYVASVIPTLPTFVTGETPSGTIDGSNATFTLAHTPTSGSLALYANGVRLKSGSGNDYTISTATITFLSGAIPVSGDVLQGDYRY